MYKCLRFRTKITLKVFYKNSSYSFIGIIIDSNSRKYNCFNKVLFIYNFDEWTVPTK